ncbi:unnamed protein product [Rhizoctonia solani]|uniref:Uncharacterized protein n=1 Tax=Rhizoctonia solani TaxID=456999 RepID=A0A8H2WT16_9AGAM|nr:unnamed protein product [Rhizoctonia solani]
MFFTRFVVTALSFGAMSIAAPIGVPGAALPVDGLLPGGSSLPVVGSKLPLDTSNPLDTSKLPLPISGGSVPSLGGGLGGTNLHLVGRSDSTYAGALDNLGGVAGGLLGNLNGAKGLDVSQLVPLLGNLNGALNGVNLALAPVQGLGVDSLLAGNSLSAVTGKTKSVLTLVGGVLNKVQSMELTSEAKDVLSNTVKLLGDMTGGLAVVPQVQEVAKGCLGGVLGSLGGLLGGLGLGL